MNEVTPPEDSVWKYEMRFKDDPAIYIQRLLGIENTAQALSSAMYAVANAGYELDDLVQIMITQV